MRRSPTAKRIGALRKPANPVSALILRQTKAAADTLGLELVPIEAHVADEFAEAFMLFAHRRRGGSNAWVKPQGVGPLNRRYSTPVGWIGAPQWIYRAEAASAGNSGGAFLAGVIFTIPLHAIRTLVCDRAPSGIAGLIGMARAHVKEHRNH
jgi:hypothetical protein